MWPLVLPLVARGLVVDGPHLRRCNASKEVWRGVAVRDLAQETQRRHDLVSVVPKHDLVFLYVPKVASSSARTYAKALDADATDGAHWPERGTAFALTRDPLERFVSASGTLLARGKRGADAWDNNERGSSIMTRCLAETLEFAARKGVGKFSYAAAAQHARCTLSRAEQHGLYWNHHLAPQISYYAVLNANARLRSDASKRRRRVDCDRYAGHDNRTTRLKRVGHCVHQPSPVLALPVRDLQTGASLVQRAWDQAFFVSQRRRRRSSDDERRRSSSSSSGEEEEEEELRPRLAETQGLYENLQEGRGRLLDYVYLLHKLGEGFQRRVCRLYADDYVCLQLPAPAVCRGILPEAHRFFKAPGFDFGRRAAEDAPLDGGNASSASSSTVVNASNHPPAAAHDVAFPAPKAHQLRQRPTQHHGSGGGGEKHR